MTKKGKILTATGIVVVLAITIGSWGWILHDKQAKADLLTKEAYAATQEQADKELEQDEKPKTYNVPPIKIPENHPAKNDSAIKDSVTDKPNQAPPTNEVERTGQNTGSVSKPEPPPPPEIPEDQKKDPTKKPEYTPEQIEPNNPDAKNDKETDGEKPDNGTNNKPPQGGEKKDGKIYVPGFGWVEDHGGGNEGKEIPSAGGDYSKQVGIM